MLACDRLQGIDLGYSVVSMGRPTMSVTEAVVAFFLASILLMGAYHLGSIRGRAEGYIKCVVGDDTDYN